MAIDTSLIQSTVVDPKYASRLQVSLTPIINGIRRAVDERLMNDRYAPFVVPFEDTMVDEIALVLDRVESVSYRMMVVVGMGGSYWSPYAWCTGMISTNSVQSSMETVFIDTIDHETVQRTIERMKRVLSDHGRILLIIITKSGTTIETMLNADYYVSLMQQYQPETYMSDIIVITDEQSLLYTVAGQQGMHRLSIPQAVGGRYAAFTAVGLFPFAFLGGTIQEALRGARDSVEDALSVDWDRNKAAMRAVTLAYYYQHRHVSIHDIFVWHPRLLGLAHWYRQLIGESLGKRSHGGQIPTGITPMVSIGSADLHSVAQLYLGGPYDKITTFMDMDDGGANGSIDHRRYEPFLSCTPALKSYHTGAQVKDAIKHATLAAYVREERPYMGVIDIGYASAYQMGYVMQMLMAETVYLGALLDVNPFDQPHVEWYKKETERLL